MGNILFLVKENLKFPKSFSPLRHSEDKKQKYFCYWSSATLFMLNEKLLKSNRRFFQFKRSQTD